MNQEVVERLLHSDEASIRYGAWVKLLGNDPESPRSLEMRAAIPASPQVKGLLGGRTAQGEIPHHPYDKWMGAHWTLAALADLSYPSGDRSLMPLREQALDWLLGDDHMGYVPKRTLNGCVRMHPSIEGNAVHYLLTLGLADRRVDELVNYICSWQWPDGGWNCDMNPETTISSFMESLIPMRALALYAKVRGDEKAARVARETAEIFLKRRLYKRMQDGAVMDKNFVQLHYPCYWHYDVLFGLKVLAEMGLSADPRCSDALDLLESRRLPDGGFPAEAKYYQVTGKKVSGRSRVDWGGTSKKVMNEWVTLDALYVLNQAGRLAL